MLKLLVFLPLFGSILSGIFPSFLGKKGVLWVPTLFCSLSLIFSIILLIQAISGESYEINDLGSDIKIIDQIYKGKHNYNKILEKSNKTLILIGESVLNRNDGAGILGRIREIAKKLEIPVVATNDCHYLTKDCFKSHDTLLLMATQILFEKLLFL